MKAICKCGNPLPSNPESGRCVCGEDLSDIKKYACSFCGELATSDNPVITGGKVSICKKCVVLASQILDSPEKEVVCVATLA